MTTQTTFARDRQGELTGRAEAMRMLDEATRQKGAQPTIIELESWWVKQCRARTRTMTQLGLDTTWIAAWIGGCGRIYQEANQVATAGRAGEAPVFQFAASPTVVYGEMIAPLYAQGVEVWGREAGIACGYFARIAPASPDSHKSTRRIVRVTYADGYQAGHQASCETHPGVWFAITDDRLFMGNALQGQRLEQE